jgi:hypothetical protein
LQEASSTEDHDFLAEHVDELAHSHDSHALCERVFHTAHQGFLAGLRIGEEIAEEASK